MNKEQLLELIGDTDERFIAELCESYPERSLSSLPAARKTCRFTKTALIAAVTACFLTISAFAVGYSIHRQRQEELRDRLNIDGAKTQSYVEYDVTGENSVVLLSAIPSGDFIRVFLNVSPVTEDEVRGFPETESWYVSPDGGESFGAAAPSLSPGRVLRQGDDFAAVIMEDAYDAETQTLTLEYYLPGFTSAGEQLELQVYGGSPDASGLCYGSVTVDLSEFNSEKRTIEFVSADITEPKSGTAVEIVSLILEPMSWEFRISYPGITDIDSLLAAESEYLAVEDYITQNAVLRFADGTELKTGGAMQGGVTDTYASPRGSFPTAIDISAVTAVIIDGIELQISE